MNEFGFGAKPGCEVRGRRLGFGLATVLGLAKRGFFIPYRHAAEVQRRGYPAIADLLGRREDAFAAVLGVIEGYAEALEAIGPDTPPEPRWNQGWFPRLDAAAAYAMVRHHAPRRIVEVGSGHSTRFLARAVRDGAIACEITAIDPQPRASIAGLPVRTIASTVQDADDAPFAALGPGDLLFIDSSHVLMPGSDVDFLLNRVLPALPAGAFVHFHDIFLPEDYPESWTWRGYNEQAAVAALIAGGEAYEIVFASHYVVTAMADRLAKTVLARLPLVEGAIENSLWLRKA